MAKHTLDELDRLAAEKVMGWNLEQDIYIPGNKFCPPGSKWAHMGRNIWQPTRNIAQAWECLEKVERDEIRMSKYQDNQWQARFWMESTEFITAEADTAPEAIVRACLRAKGVNLDNG